MDIWKLLLQGSECLASLQALAREARVLVPPGDEQIKCGVVVSPHLGMRGESCLCRAREDHGMLKEHPPPALAS